MIFQIKTYLQRFWKWMIFSVFGVGVALAAVVTTGISDPLVVLPPVDEVTIIVEEETETIKIHTWACSNGYRQDFEPTKENMAIHFAGLGLEDYECPTIRGETMFKVVNPDQKIKLKIRITDTVIEKMKPTSDDIAHLKDLESKIKKVKEMKALEPGEQKWENKKIELENQYIQYQRGIPKVRETLKAVTPQELQAMKNKYEDK